MTLRRLLPARKNNAEITLYSDLRDETDLTANLVQKNIRRAIRAVDVAVEKLKQGEKTNLTRRFDFRTAWPETVDEVSLIEVQYDPIALDLATQFLPLIGLAY